MHLERGNLTFKSAEAARKEGGVSRGLKKEKGVFNRNSSHHEKKKLRGREEIPNVRGGGGKDRGFETRPEGAGGSRDGGVDVGQGEGKNRNPKKKMGFACPEAGKRR